MRNIDDRDMKISIDRRSSWALLELLRPLLQACFRLPQLLSQARKRT